MPMCMMNFRKDLRKTDDAKGMKYKAKDFPIIPEISDVRHVMEQGRSHWMYSFAGCDGVSECKGSRYAKAAWQVCK